MGRCFESAAGILIDFTYKFKGWWLCHGVVTGTGGKVKGKSYSHAWIESETLVFDTEAVMMCDKDLYYKAGNVRDVVRYSEKEAREMLLQHKNYGPWNERFFRGDLEG